MKIFMTSRNDEGFESNEKIIVGLTCKIHFIIYSFENSIFATVYGPLSMQHLWT